MFDWLSAAENILASTPWADATGANISGLGDNANDVFADQEDN